MSTIRKPLSAKVRDFVVASAVCMLLGGASTAAYAIPAPVQTTLTFNDLSGSNGSTFLSYSESEYLFTSLAGSSKVATYFGAPVPDIFFGSRYSDSASNSFGLTAGSGLFSLNSFQLATQNTLTSYTITGSIAGLSAYSYSGTATSSGFATFLGNNVSVDSVKLSFNGVATNLDNLVLTGPVAAVPEPATWAMMILGMGAVGFAMRTANCRSDQKFDAKIKRITAGALA